MEKQDFKILVNRPLAQGIYEMVLVGDTSHITRPGQFLNFQLEGFYLRRPISVCDWTEETVTILYKVLGRGTQAMTQRKSGETMNLLTGLGNGYDMDKSGPQPLLVGGGVGIPPLYGLARRLRAQG